MHMFRSFVLDLFSCLCVAWDFSFCFMAVALLRLFSPFVLGSPSRSLFLLSVGLLAEPGVSLSLCLFLFANCVCACTCLYVGLLREGL